MLHRYELQLWEPDKGGWRVMLTANEPERLVRAAHTLAWQSQKPVRVVDPEGAVVHGAVEDEDELAPRG